MRSAPAILGGTVWLAALTVWPAVLAAQPPIEAGVADLSQEPRPPGTNAPGINAPSIVAPAAGSAGTGSAGERSPSAERDRLLQHDLIYLPGPGGELIPVPATATLKDYLDWIKTRDDRDQPRPAGCAVAAITLDGTAEEDRAVLSVKLQVQVTRANEWFTLPLALTEAVLQEVKYQGPGEATAGRFDAESGYHWWFRGLGSHELELRVHVPLRKQPPVRRLQLALPTSAVSSLTLRVPQARVSARAPEKSTLMVRALEGASELVVYGLGSRLDVSWQAVAEVSPAENMYETVTAIAASLVDGETLTLEVSQQLKALQGLLDEVRVHLPPSAELLRVDGLDYQDHRIDPAHPHQVVVKLRRPTAGPVELKWTLRSKLPPLGTPIVFEGFQTERARIQTGFLALGLVGDFRLTPASANDRFVQRINLQDLPASLRQSQVSAAYRFLNQPFRLEAGLRREEPYMTVRPVVRLQFSHDHVECDATYQFQVFRASVREVSWRWPSWQAAGWNVEVVEDPQSIEAATLDPATESIQVRLLRPANQAFTVRLRGRRRIDVATPLSLTLPVPHAGKQAPSLLSVSASDDLEVALTALRASDLTPLAPGSSFPQVPASDAPGSVRKVYRLDAADAVLQANVTAHQQIVSLTSDVGLEMEEGRMAVRQKLRFESQYERLTSLKLNVALEAAPEQVRFFHEGLEIVPIWAKGSPGAAREVVLNVDQPRPGPLDVEARWTIALPPVGGSSVPCRVPLFECAAWPAMTTRLKWSNPGLGATVADPAWVRDTRPGSGPSWVRNGSSPLAELQLTRAPSSPTQEVIVARALLRTWISEEGTTTTRAQYRLPASLASVSVAFERGVIPLAFWWGDLRLSPGSNRATESGTTWELPLPPGAAGEQLLTIDLQEVQTSHQSVVSGNRLRPPQLGSGLWCAAVYWQVSVPSTQHLFVEPRDFAAEYHWQRDGLFWRRQPNQGELSLLKWVGAQPGPPDNLPHGVGHAYLFSRSGTAALNLDTMNQSGIVLTGAGLALVVGWLLVLAPRLRHVLTPLALGACISLAAVWFPGPVLLMLQPAGLGLLLAFGAAATDGMLKRRRARERMLALAPASGFTLSAGLDREVILGVGSNEFTALRPPVASSIELGSGVDAGGQE